LLIWIPGRRRKEHWRYLDKKLTTSRVTIGRFVGRKRA